MDDRDPSDTRDPGDPAGDAVDPAARAAEDAAMALVRAADPAVGAAPDTVRLHARLTDATGVALGAGAAAGGDQRDDLAAARVRRRTPARWLQVAAVAAGVALVGGGGYAVGAAGGDEPSAPPIALQGAGGAPEPASDESAAGRTLMAPDRFGGRTLFSGSGLEGAAGSSRAWALDATSAATSATAARAAAALGVTGEPRQEWGQWIVGTSDGSSATVQVGVDGQAGLWFYDPARDPSLCTIGTPDTPDGPDGPDGAESSSSGAQGAADPSVCDPASTPTGDAAIARARDLMERLGVDTAGYELTVTTETGLPGLVSVTAAHVVDGMQTGLLWTVQLAGNGVQSASGPLATLVELGTYDRISADEAVDRLNDPRFGASYGGMVTLAARSEGVDDVASMEAPVPDEPTVPPVPAPGDPVAWPVQDVTITGARLGVTLLTTPAGAVVLVPAWELTDADGGTWSVVAVVEDQLDLSAA